jgi:predicted glycoside hydrolase/deacetylase ChbG (UPF0249 family)
MKKLIITADDYGVCESVNEGILIAAREGAISNISTFTNYDGTLETLKEIAIELPDLGIGVHLNLNTGRPLSDPADIPSIVNEKGEFYDIEDFVLKLPEISGQEIYTEYRAQITALNDCGIELDHISSHFGVCTLYPPFFKLANQLSLEFGVPVRSPVSAGRKYPDVYRSKVNERLGRELFRKLAWKSPSTAFYLKKQFEVAEMEAKSNELDALGIKHPDLMIDAFFGNPTADNLIHMLENLPPGTSEIIVHPGNIGWRDMYPNEPDTLNLRNRECELMTITSPMLNEYLSKLQIKKISYSDLYR